MKPVLPTDFGLADVKCGYFHQNVWSEWLLASNLKCRLANQAAEAVPGGERPLSDWFWTFDGSYPLHLSQELGLVWSGCQWFLFLSA